jgi:hypothetical protein
MKKLISYGLNAINIKDSSQKLTRIPHKKSPTLLTDKSSRIMYHLNWLGRKQSGDLNRSQKRVFLQGSHRRTITETGVKAGFNFLTHIFDDEAGY